MGMRMLLMALVGMLMLAGCAATGGPGAGVAPTATPLPTSAATATIAPPPPTTAPPAAPTGTPMVGLVPIDANWARWHDTTGYQLNIPTFLHYFPGQDDPVLDAHFFDNGMGQPYVELTIRAVDQVSPHLCSGGTPTTVGHGIRALEKDTLTRPPNTPSAPITFAVEFVAGGLDITFTFATTLSASDMQAKYGATWRAILASFIPGPTVGHVQPCP